MTQNRYRASRTGLAVLAMALLLTVVTGCGRELDPRCDLVVDSRNRDMLSHAITKSDLWQSYFDAQTGSGKLVEFSLTMDREQFDSIGGDYDCGEVTIAFRIEHLGTGTMLFRKDVDLDLEAFLIGFFDREATREEIQEIAFQATEERITPYLNRWVDLAAIRAMAADGRDVYVSALSDVLDASSSGRDMRNEATRALQTIQG